MAKLPTLRRLFKNDFKPQYSELVEKLIVSINNGFDNVYDALNNKITLRNNVLCNIKDFTVQVSSTGVPITNLNLAVTFNNNINIITVGKIDNVSIPTAYPTGGVTISWEQLSPGLVKVKHITGLTEGQTYNIRVVIYGDEN
jgi:archaellum component FlaF (FlaF/FlaG flagellin family)